MTRAVTIAELADQSTFTIDGNNQPSWYCKC